MSRMNADETGAHGSTASKTASIFKNPFDVEKDQLIRQIFELPVRIAEVVQSRRNQLGNSSADKIELPLSIFAAKLTSREEMGERQSVSAKMGDFNETVLKQPSRDPLIDDMECATEARHDGIKKPITYGRRKRKRIEHSQAASSSLEYTSKSSADDCLCIDTTSQNRLGELDAESQKSCKQLSVSANENSSKQDEKLVEKCMPATQKQGVTPGSSQTAKKTRQVASQNEVVPVLPVSTIKMKPHDVAKFIVNVIRTLRHTRDSNMQKLFEILSVPDFPVEKCSFLEELIQQARCYNKEWVAKELGKYHSEIMLMRMTDSQRG